MSFVPLLRVANTKILAFLSRHGCEDNGSAGGAGVTAEELRELRHRVRDVGSRIDEVMASRGCPSMPEIPEYIQNLERLVPLLQSARQQLLARRQHLNEQRSCFARVKCWANAYKAILYIN
jgi:hypothetical protein